MTLHRNYAAACQETHDRISHISFPQRNFHKEDVSNGGVHSTSHKNQNCIEYVFSTNHIHEKITKRF